MVPMTIRLIFMNPIILRAGSIYISDISCSAWSLWDDALCIILHSWTHLWWAFVRLIRSHSDRAAKIATSDPDLENQFSTDKGLMLFNCQEITKVRIQIHNVRMHFVVISFWNVSFIVLCCLTINRPTIGRVIIRPFGIRLREIPPFGGLLLLYRVIGKNGGLFAGILSWKLRF